MKLYLDIDGTICDSSERTERLMKHYPELRDVWYRGAAGRSLTVPDAAWGLFYDPSLMLAIDVPVPFAKVALSQYKYDELIYVTSRHEIAEKGTKMWILKWEFPFGDEFRFSSDYFVDDLAKYKVSQLHDCEPGDIFIDDNLAVLEVSHNAYPGLRCEKAPQCWDVKY